MTTAPDTTELLEALCRIDSRTTAGAAGTIEASTLLADRLVALGFEVEWRDPDRAEEPCGRHLRAVRNPTATPRLVFLGHTDTVLSPMQAPFRTDDSQGRCYGSGVCDMKGGCVVLFDAIRRALAKHTAVRDAGLVVLVNCAEEVGSLSFAALAREEAQGAVACLGFEAWRMGPDGTHQIVDHRKGVSRFLLTCHGRAAHAGGDHAQGISAIREIARKIERLEALTDHARELTVTVGRVEGGVAVNQVPDTARAWVDLRAYDPGLLDQTSTLAHRICLEPTMGNEIDGATTRLELSERPGFPAWPRRDDATDLIQRTLRIAKAHGIKAQTTGSGGGSDASHVADLAPTIDGLGILGGKAHQTGEWADLASLPTRAAVASDLIAELCDGEQAR